MPLIFLTEGEATVNDPPNSFGALQKELVHLSASGSQRFVDGGHMIQVDYPEAVIDAVLSIVGKIRGCPRNDNGIGSLLTSTAHRLQARCYWGLSNLSLGGIASRTAEPLL
jgi:hypothetical protein